MSCEVTICSPSATRVRSTLHVTTQDKKFGREHSMSDEPGCIMQLVSGGTPSNVDVVPWKIVLSMTLPNGACGTIPLVRAYHVFLTTMLLLTPLHSQRVRSLEFVAVLPLILVQIKSGAPGKSV